MQIEALSEAFFDPEAGGDHQAELYAAASIAERVSPEHAVTETARLHYDRHGWLAVKDLFRAPEIADAMAAMDALIHRQVLGFKGIMYEGALRNRLPGMTEAERYDAVRKLFGFVRFEPRMLAMSRQPAMLAIVRNLLGGKSPRLFQDMALIKPPVVGREKPWHQDHAFFDFTLDTRFLGVWIALDPATMANGCMHVLDRGHLEGPRTHYRRRDVQLCDADMLGQRSVAFPLEPGDAMFFDGLLPHGTPANSSPDRRRAVQFHYCPEGAAEMDSAERLRIFGAEGKDATC